MKARSRSKPAHAPVRHRATAPRRGLPTRGAARRNGRTRSAEAAGGGLGGRKVLGASLPQQEERNWCWAAVASGVASFFGKTISQCEVASRTLGDDCCAGRGPCDRPWSLDDALHAVDHYRGFAEGTVSLGEVATEIDRSAPLAARIQWKRDGGGHFILIDGYDADEDLVVVRDPATSEGPQWMPIREVASAYRSGAGYWSHTYWVE